MSIAINIDHLDAMHQLRDEMHVVWLALGNETDMSESALYRIREHVNGIHLRFSDICKEIDAAPRVQSPVSASTTTHAMLDRMSLEHLHHVYDALGTIFDVASGLMEQPRFAKSDSETLLNDAGGILERTIYEVAGNMRDQIIRIVEARPAIERNDRDRKFALLASQYIDGVSTADACVAAIVKIGSELAGGSRS